MQQTVNGLALGSSYALLAVGVTLVWGVLGILNFAHAQILTWGAFGALFALNSGMPVLVGVAAGILAAGVISVILELSVLSPLRSRGASEFSFVVATIGASLVLETVLRWRTEAQTVGFPRAGFPTGAMQVFGITVPRLHVVMLVVSIAAMAGLTLWIRKTAFGRSIRAVAYDSETARLMGVNTRVVFATCFFVAGGLAAISGIFMAVSSAQTAFDAGSRLLLVAFAAVILGGMGSIKGAVIGGILLGLIEVYATAYISSTFREVVAFATIFLVLVVRPSGIFGEEQVSRV